MGDKVHLIDIILGSGLGATALGWIYTAGRSTQKRCELENRVSTLETTQERHDKRLDQHDVQYATIDAKLDLLIDLNRKEK